jgi:hypothetical protein
MDTSTQKNPYAGLLMIMKRKSIFQSDFFVCAGRRLLGSCCFPASRSFRSFLADEIMESPDPVPFWRSTQKGLKLFERFRIVGRSLLYNVEIITHNS